MSGKQKSAFDAAAYWNSRYQTIDVSKSGHIDFSAEYNAWLYRRKQEHVAKAVKRVGNALLGCKLLEVAAGSGAWMEFWESQEIKEYSGIDLSERAIDGLKKRFPGRRFLQHDLNDLGLGAAVGNGYDWVSAIDVLYYVTDDARFQMVLADLAAVLKPGGMLIIHDQFLHGAALDHEYLKWRTLVDYKAFLRAAGFEILYRRPTFFFMIQAVDFSGLAATFMKTVWQNLTFPFISRFPRLAGFVGYSLDSVICAMLQEGPSMELMICQKSRT